MKALFAVNNEKISESIIKKYQQDYKEIISVKNVYYFNAIIKELQRDKTYDRIVIAEELQPYSNTNYDSIDKFIFEKLDNISDEATNQSGNDIPIIFICTDRRAKSEPFLVKLFGIGVYNALIGKDRTITQVCELLSKPRTKKEAKVYYRIDSEDVDYKVENEGDVSEVEIQNILSHYKKLGGNEQKYVESFDHIATQYTDAQLRLIAKFLPLNVKAVLEANSLKYQQVISFAGTTSNSNTSTKVQQPVKYNNYSKNAKQPKVKEEPKNEKVNLDVIENNLNKNKMTDPVIIPSAINTANVKKMDEVQSEQSGQEQNVQNQEVGNEPITNQESPSNVQIQETTTEENTESAQPKRRGRPKKVQSEAVEEEKAKRGRGRPKKVGDVDVATQQEGTEQQDNVIVSEGAPVNLFELGDEEAPAITSTISTQNTNSGMILPGLEDEPVSNQNVGIAANSIQGSSQSQVASNGVENQRFAPYNNIQNNNMSAGQQQQPISSFNTQGQNPNLSYGSNQIENTTSYASNNLSSLLTRDKKIVAFVGTSKNGTSFLVNNIAETLSQKGINTAILDLTRNKNAYYIYTENEENLRKTAYSCIDELRRGNATGIQVHKNLTVYTTIPGEESADDYNNILPTLVQNYSLIILDCDFDTEYGYFNEAQEIYLVQSLDVLTIQPLTAFLRNLKAKNALNPEKIRIVLNKVVHLRSVNEKTIIGGMAFYNDPSMSFMTELFNKDSVTYCSIPFEEQAYAKYLDGLVNCKISLNGYSKNFVSTLEKLGNMVYPLINNNMKNKNNNYNNYSSNNNYQNNYQNNNQSMSQNNFSNDMNDTLNRMKNSY